MMPALFGHILPFSGLNISCCVGRHLIKRLFPFLKLNVLLCYIKPRADVLFTAYPFPRIWLGIFGAQNDESQNCFNPTEWWNTIKLIFQKTPGGHYNVTWEYNQVLKYAVLPREPGRGFSFVGWELIQELLLKQMHLETGVWK